MDGVSGGICLVVDVYYSGVVTKGFDTRDLLIGILDFF